MPVFLPAGVVGGRRTFDQSSAPSNQNRGDIWRERDAATNDLIESWFWNGTYWLSTDIKEIQYGLNSASANTSQYFPIELRLTQYNIFCLNWVVATTVATTDATNFWRVQIHRRNAADNSATILSSIQTSTWVSGSPTIARNAIDTHLNLVGGLDARNFWIYLVRVGTPGNIAPLTATFTYRLARP